MVHGNAERIRDPELLDTSERREAYRRMLPAAVRAQVLSVEARVMDASARELKPFTTSLLNPHPPSKTWG